MSEKKVCRKFNTICSDARIVVYDPEQKVWGYQYYTNAFYKELKNNYAQFSENTEDDWKNKIWIRTN